VYSCNETGQPKRCNALEIEPKRQAGLFGASPHFVAQSVLHSSPGRTSLYPSATHASRPCGAAVKGVRRRCTASCTAVQNPLGAWAGWEGKSDVRLGGMFLINEIQHDSLDPGYFIGQHDQRRFCCKLNVPPNHFP
jgi:hypothetical protein